MRGRKGWFTSLAFALLALGVPAAQTQHASAKPKAAASLEDARAAKLSKARLAMARAPGDALPPDGQDSSPEFFPQGRADIRYVVVQGDGDVKTPHVCLIAQSYDGRKVRRLWKLPTRRVRPGDKPGSGTLAKAMFDQGCVPARKPRPEEAEALSRHVGLAGYYVSGPGSGAYAWFVDVSRKSHEKHRTEMGYNPPVTGAIYYAITPEERAALGWRRKP